jgi:hypothetical protein
MQSLGIMIDVSHSSEQVVKDVLAVSSQPLLVIHTGLYGHCPPSRNMSDVAGDGWQYVALLASTLARLNLLYIMQSINFEYGKENTFTG